MIFVPAVTPQVSLLVCTASNQLNEKLILERILLQAKIFGWDKDRLTKFFEPNQAFADYDSFKGRQVVTRELIEPGLGNWLLNYKKRMTPSVRKKQLASILVQFQEMKIDELLARHPVSVVIAKSNRIISPTGFARKTETSGYSILVPVTAINP